MSQLRGVALNPQSQPGVTNTRAPRATHFHSQYTHSQLLTRRERSTVPTVNTQPFSSYLDCPHVSHGCQSELNKILPSPPSTLLLGNSNLGP